MQMSNKTYDILKRICQIILPAIATIYWILSGIFDILPYGEQVVGACVALVTCLGAMLGYSSYKYEEEGEEEEIEESEVG